MVKAIRRITLWLGPARSRIIFVLLALTGLGSLMLNVIGTRIAWVAPAQSGLLIVFMVGAAATVLTRYSADERRQVAFAVLDGIPQARQ